MKQYPSIPIVRPDGREMYIFDKHDGSNLRFEWSKKKGWYKYGTRTHLFDESDPAFGSAVPLFHKTYASKIEKILSDNRFDESVVFMEFEGPSSFAGHHIVDEPKILILIDVTKNKKGIVGPKEFLNLFEDTGFCPAFLGRHQWTDEFVRSIREEQLEGITFEGVVGKAGEYCTLKMAKAKTQRWIDKVKARYGEKSNHDY